MNLASKVSKVIVISFGRVATFQGNPERRVCEDRRLLDSAARIQRVERKSKRR